MTKIDELYSNKRYIFKWYTSFYEGYHMWVLMSIFVYINNSKEYIIK